MTTQIPVGADTPTLLADRLVADTFAGYAYSYPHKSAYRQLDPPVDVATAWAHQDTSSVFLYTHLPFCEMRCGFCNLFTTIRPGEDFMARTLAAIARQSADMAEAIRPGQVTTAAFGGGTPSFLDTDELITLFEQLAATWPVSWADIPVSFEISPGTVDRTKLDELHRLGVTRISMGVQSFVDAELKALARPQNRETVDNACAQIVDVGFDTFNLDLIYGMENQTVDSWLFSLAEAVRRGPNDLYLYPLYVRELTGMGRTGRVAGEHRRELYRIGRDYLLDAGFVQRSMRNFQRPHSAAITTYSCQEDGMVGLGPGARSYTSNLHYSTEFAVGQKGVRNIIESFSNTEEFGTIDHGVRLSVEDEERRFVIQGLLQVEGLDENAFTERFGRSTIDALPQLVELAELGLAETSVDTQTTALTAKGFEYSDVIGPWLYSPAVQAQMDTYDLV